MGGRERYQTIFGAHELISAALRRTLTTVADTGANSKMSKLISYAKRLTGNDATRWVWQQRQRFTWRPEATENSYMRS